MIATYYAFPPEKNLISSVTTVDDVRVRIKKQMEEGKNRKGRWIKDSNGQFQFIQFPD